MGQLDNKWEFLLGAHTSDGHERATRGNRAQLVAEE